MLTDAQFSQLINTLQGSPWDQTLQRAYWVSQVCLVVVVVIAAFAAFRQVYIIKLFELLKFVEQEEFRKARRVVYFEIREEPVGKKWWTEKEHADWEEAAARVCEFYDILGLITLHNKAARLATRCHIGVGWFFTSQWSASIVNAHKALQPYLAYRRETQPKAYRNFTRLYCRARPHARIISQETS